MKRFPLLVALLLLQSFVLPAAFAAQVVAAPAAHVGAPSVPALRFDLTRPEMRAAYRDASSALDGALSRIAATPPAQADFANTVLAQERALADYSRAMSPLVFLGYVSADKGVRMTAQAVEKVMGRRLVELGQREDIYRRVEAAAAKGEVLDSIDRRLLDKTMRDYRDSGFALAPEQRARLKAIQTKLGDLSARFEKNISNHKDWLETDEAGLDGLPADDIAKLKKTPDGKYKVGLGYTEYRPFMNYAKSAELRRALLDKYENRAAKPNLPILKEALQLRQELARLLGYADYPAFALKDRMTPTPSAVSTFLSRLTRKVRARAESELSALLEVKRRAEPGAVRIENHEYSYYSRILEAEKYGYDAEEVRQYFPEDRVVSGTLKVYESILGVVFREIKNGPVWHPDVRLFEIVDTKSAKPIGHFYLDMHPRDGKYTHAAAFPLLKGRATAEGYDRTAAAMVSNFPSATPGKPALLPFSEVETFFHEFGHEIHQTLTKARHMSFAGTEVALDFVEAPSQMLENFAWERGVLDEISGRWDTGEKLPEELFKKMTAGRRFNGGMQMLRQIALASADLALHTLVPEDPSSMFNRIMSEITGMPLSHGHFVASFGHLLGGYGSGYSSYALSKVLAEDFYSIFKAEGPLNPVPGGRYRRAILEPGSERPEAESVREFLGREPNEEAFMKTLEDETPARPAS